jgi:hypothetical protein
VEGDGFELFVPLGDQCLSELVEPCAETTWRARGEFLRGGTNSSNPSPSSGESTNFRFLSRRRPLFDRMITLPSSGPWDEKALIGNPPLPMFVEVVRLAGSLATIMEYLR